MHNNSDKYDNASGADALPMSDNMTSSSSTSNKKLSSSFQLLTTSSTLTSGFLTITVGVTSTLYPTPANSESLQSTAISSHVTLPIRFSSRSSITLTYSGSAPPETTISPKPVSASASNPALPDWIGSLVTGKEHSSNWTQKTAAEVR